jgi:DNA (cytosine-5)-methyltransferase 1
MGGNKTPIVDDAEIFEGIPSFVEAYHADLIRGEPSRRGNAPGRLRRLTVDECLAIQTFPKDYFLFGKRSAQYRQIGNAVPCKLAEVVGNVAKAVVEMIFAEEAALMWDRTAIAAE